MKKRIMLVALMFVLSVQFLHAQRGGGCPIDDVCDPTPTPTPIPTATPTPTPLPTPTPTDSGHVGPKYVVLAVTYAPPGANSFVTYSNSTIFGSSLSLTGSFTAQTAVTVTDTETLKPLLGFGSSNTTTSSTTFVEELDASASIAVTEQALRSFTSRGPLSSAVGINHDADIIWLWLNPVLNFSIPSPNTLQWPSVGFDNRYPGGDVELIGVPVAFLNGHAPIFQDIKDALSRGWLCVGSNDPECRAGGAHDPGLTSTDFTEILKADPFTDPAYLIDVPTGSICTADGRFCNATTATFEYAPPPQGQQPVTQTFTETRTAAATQGLGASVSLAVGFGDEFTINSSDFLFNFSNALKIADTLTLVSKLNLLNSQQAQQISTVSITGPAFTDNYTGPVLLNVFQDNIYGTFMFGAIPDSTFDVDVSPASQSVPQGGCINYSVSVVALVSGFNKTVTFSVSGLPANATGIFTPPSVTGAGSSTLQVCAASLTPLGTGPLAIKGAAATESHTANPGLTVTPPPDFTLSATPASQSVVPGATASYTVPVTALNGFSGAVNLSIVSGLPAGATATFTPASITGTGSSTLGIATSTTTPPGTYTICIAGVSGSLSHSACVTLTLGSAPAGDFSLSASPGSQTVNAGDSASYTISSTALNGFTGTVSLTASGPGGDVFVDLFPASISGNGTTTLSVSTDSNTAAGTYFITITGVSGSLNHSASVTLTVNTPPGGCDPFCPIQ